MDRQEREASRLVDMAYNAGYDEGSGRAVRAKRRWNQVLARLVKAHDEMTRRNYEKYIREFRLRDLRARAESARRMGREDGARFEGTPERRVEEKAFRQRLRTGDKSWMAIGRDPRRGRDEKYDDETLRRWVLRVIDGTIELTDLLWRAPTLVSDAGPTITRTLREDRWDESTRDDLSEQALNASRGQIREYAREMQTNVRPARDRSPRRRPRARSRSLRR